MEKHVSLVAILNIVYRGLIFLGACALLAVALFFGRLFEYLIREGFISPRDIPVDIFSIIPLFLFIIASVMFLLSVLGIIGAIGLLKKKEWGRILVLVISFFHLTHVPLGTVLGVYSIWVLLSNETIRMFNPGSASVAVQPASPAPPAA